MPQKNIVPLEPDGFYHIFNRGVGQIPIFYNQENYSYFLELFHRHIGSVADTFAYCLMKNHFHFLIRMKGLEDLPEIYRDGNRSLSLPFSHWFNAYTQAVNKSIGRTGGLFERPFKRVEVLSEEQLLHNVFYIHANPQKHGVVEDFRTFHWSSYGAFANNSPTKLMRDEVLDWFGGMSKFQEYHQDWHEYLNDLELEP